MSETQESTADEKDDEIGGASEANGRAASLAPTETTEARYLEPGRVRLERHGASLRLTIEEEVCYPRVTVVRMFPLSDPETYLSVRDAANKEVGIITRLADVDEQARKLIREELERRYLVPVIRRVLTVKERFGTVDWQVETDRGRRAFTTRNLRENVAQPQPGRYILSDTDGNRYDIPDLSALDAASQNFILRFV